MCVCVCIVLINAQWMNKIEATIYGGYKALRIIVACAYILVFNQSKAEWAIELFKCYWNEIVFHISIQINSTTWKIHQR